MYVFLRRWQTFELSGGMHWGFFYVLNQQEGLFVVKHDRDLLRLGWDAFLSKHAEELQWTASLTLPCKLCSSDPGGRGQARYTGCVHNGNILAQRNIGKHVHRMGRDATVVTSGDCRILRCTRGLA